MKNERQQEIERLYKGALERKPEARSPYLHGACDDESLRKEVESLLACHSEANSLTEFPAVEAAAQAPARDGELGTQFGNYVIHRLLGRGGMGEVYEAEDVEGGRQVALKVLHQALSSDLDRERFFREGRLAASINHTNSVFIFGSSEVDGTPVISMELLQGGTLKDLVRKEGRLDATKAVDAILQVIAGLKAAEAVGVLHRDVKPSNCFVTNDGTVKVGDFGLSISTLAREETQLTGKGTILGTPAFSSPEQLRGGPLDVRSDIYSVGATLFTLLTGLPPFEQQSIVNLIAAVLGAPAAFPKELGAQIPKRLVRVVLRCLAKDPIKRFPDYPSLERALLPFSSTVGIPARLGQRVYANVFDQLLLFLPTGLVMALAAQYPIRPGGLVEFSLRMGVISFAVQMVYFGSFEGLWGASLGKALCRLRVVGPDQSVPGVWRALIRVLVFGVLTGGFAWHFDPGYSPKDFGPMVSIAGLLLAFSTARGRNGFSGLHDFASGTRVIRRSVISTRQSVPDVSGQPCSTYYGRRIGPYAVRAELADGENGSILLGYDERLRRDVWIQCQPSASAPVAAWRRDLGRPGRLRWLNGRRRTEECWDIYEAPGGASFISLIRQQQKWSQVRHWLLDLARELQASAKDGSMPAHLGLGQVWIARDGRALLLDLPMSTEAAACPETLISRKTMGPLQHFLHRIGSAALREVSDGSQALKLPLHARSLLKRLEGGMFPDMEALVASLQSSVGAPAELSHGRRIAHLALSASVPVVGTVLGGAIQFVRSNVEWSAVVAMLTTFLLYSAMLGLYSALMFRGGLVLQLLGIAVAARGVEASRPRAVARACIAWFPAALFGLGVATGIGVLQILALSMLLVGLVRAIVRPERGLQDLIAGTHLAVH